MSEHNDTQHDDTQIDRSESDSEALEHDSTDSAADAPPEDRPTGSRTFSQDDVNRLVQVRLQRLRTKMVEPEVHESIVAERDRLRQDLGRLQAELGKEQALRQRNQARAELAAAAQRFGAVDAEQVARLMEAHPGRDAAQSAEAPADVNDAVARFLSANPHLVRPGARRGSGSRRSEDTAAAFSREAIRRMSPEQFRRHEARILAAARRGDIV